MVNKPLYKYSIPLEETQDGLEPVYDYPEGNNHTTFQEESDLIVVRDEVIPQFHKESIAVKVEMIAAEEIEEIESP